MIVLLNLFDNSFNKPKTSVPVFVSRFPVGSSARIIAGLFISDLAIATLCCSPPLKLNGLNCILYFNPRKLSNRIAQSLLSVLLIPPMIDGNSTFLRTVVLLIKL